MEEFMKNKIITLSLALLCSMAISQAYGMEKPGQEDNLDQIDMTQTVDLLLENDAIEKVDRESDPTEKIDIGNEDADDNSPVESFDNLMAWLKDDISTFVLNYDIKSIKKLLAEGCDPNSVCDGSWPNYEGVSGLSLAVREENYDLVKLLLDSGADQYLQTTAVFGTTIYGDVLRRFTAFDWALWNNNDVMVQIFIDHGFDINKEGPQGLPLRLAYGKCLQLLLENGADINKLNSVNGLPPLFDAIVNHENQDIYSPTWLQKAQLLCDKGANINFQDESGKTVAFYLIENVCIQLLKYLYERGLDLTIADKKGLTPLQYAEDQLKHYKNRFGRDVAEIDGNMRSSKYSSKQSFVNKLVKSQKLEKRRKAIEKLSSKEFLDYYQEIASFVNRGDIEFAKKMELLSIGPRYNKQAFNIKHESDMSAYKNVEKIEQLSETLLRGQDGRDLSPYISARAPQVLEFVNYVKVNGSSTDKESKRFKN